METVKSKLIKIWQQQIPCQFKKGLLTYERQLQSEFYYHLKKDLPEGYHIWIEPVVTLSESNSKSYSIIPDMIITCQDKIVAVVEMKFKPWEYVAYKDDLNKLTCLSKLKSTAKEFTFGYIPICSNWQVQKDSPDTKTYHLASDYLSVYIAFAHPDSDVFRLQEDVNVPTPFLFLHGHISKQRHPENYGHYKFESSYLKKAKSDEVISYGVITEETTPIVIPIV